MYARGVPYGEDSEGRNRRSGMDIADGDYREQGSTYLKALSSLWALGEVTTVSAHNLDYSTEEEVERKVEDAILRVREICKTF